MSRLFKNLVVFSLLILAVGCAKDVTITKNTVYFMSKLVDDLPNGIDGRISCKTDEFCYLETNRATYPSCISHEVERGHAGLWYEGYKSTWSCSNKTYRKID